MDTAIGGSILKNKWFLYVTEFFSGVSVMAIELGASRLLAPYFSSSQVVWTVIIGTIMIAMALGNVIGGRLADKHPDPSRLYGRLLIAAVWTAAIPFLGKFVILGVSAVMSTFVSHNFLVWTSLVVCFIVFVFPLLLLGTVTPSLVKYAVNNLDDTGKTVGYLGALNTIGSIIGTFLPTFVTIPAVGTAATFLIFAAVLALLSVIYFVSLRQRYVKCAVSLVLIAGFGTVSFGSSFAFWEKNLVYEDESIYNYLQVKEDAVSVQLSTNVLFGVQSIMMKNGELTGMYYDYALAAPVMANLQAGGDVLVLGLGTGTFAKACTEYFPKCTVEGVEIDEKIAALSSEYFALPESVKVHVDDGRAFLREAGTYDVIMVDAYQDITIPFQMSTVEFFTEVRNHLKPGGVMVVNMNMRSSEENSINDYLCDTIASVFPNVYTAPVSSGTNCEIFAAMDGTALDNFQKGYPKLQNQKLREAMAQVDRQLSPYQGQNRILTDDKAPVEVLGMRALDEIINRELDAFRGQDLFSLLP